MADAETGAVPPGQPDSGWAAPAWAAPAETAPPATASRDRSCGGRSSGGRSLLRRPLRSAAETASDQATSDQAATDQAATDQAATDQPATDEPAVDEPAADPADSMIRLQALPASSVSEDGELLRLVRIGGETDPAPYPEDPWLPGSRRPDRRLLVIGVVVIAGLLAVASTAWLVGTNQPQAGGAHRTHVSRPSQLGSGHAQPSEALSGHPVPTLSPATPPAPVQTGAGPVKPSPKRAQPGRRYPRKRGTGPAAPAARALRTPDRAGPDRSTRDPASPAGSGPGQPGPGQPSARGSAPARRSPARAPASPPGQPGPGTPAPGQPGPGQPGPARAAPGTVRGTVPPAPQPNPPAPPPKSGGRSRHPGHGLVSIAPGLAGRADVRRVAALLDRYFAAVNHRAYQAYARLFAQPGRLTPHEFTWGYSTTHDSNAVLAGLTAPTGGLKATVTFTSHQDPAHSPDHSSCIDWTIALFLHRAGPAYLIGMPPRGYRAGLHACRFAPRPPAQGQARHPTRPAPAPGTSFPAPTFPRRGSKHQRRTNR